MPSDNVQHDLQLWSLIIFPKEENLGYSISVNSWSRQCRCPCRRARYDRHDMNRLRQRENIKKNKQQKQKTKNTHRTRKRKKKRKSTGKNWRIYPPGGYIYGDLAGFLYTSADIIGLLTSTCCPWPALLVACVLYTLVYVKVCSSYGIVSGM